MSIENSNSTFEAIRGSVRTVAKSTPGLSVLYKVYNEERNRRILEDQLRRGINPETGKVVRCSCGECKRPPVTLVNSESPVRDPSEVTR